MKADDMSATLINFDFPTHTRCFECYISDMKLLSNTGVFCLFTYTDSPYKALSEHKCLVSLNYFRKLTALLC